ncbi:MAG: acyltransferase [Chthoniobacterales bacterium]
MRTYNGEFLTRPALEALGVTCTGDDVRVHVSVVIVNPPGLYLGDHVRVDPFCVLSATGNIKLHNYAHIAGHCTLMGAGGIEMEDYTNLSHGVRVFSATDDTIGRHIAGATIPAAFRSVRSAPVTFKRHSAVGAGAVILPGVTLGEGAIVGWNSMVRKSVPDWTLWLGVPAKRVGKRRKDLLELERLLVRTGANSAEKPPSL